MFRRQLIALGLAFAMLLPFPAAAGDRASAAAGLVEDTPPDPMAERRAAPAAAGSAGGAGREEAPSRE